uniref:Uncharacterized protein n=1 Tax=Arundo donax TaxID=35708 RepID=A0A0A8YTH7_ARUDO
MWCEKGFLTPDQQDVLMRPFTVEEGEYALKEMKNDTAPGPDGFPVFF